MMKRYVAIPLSICAMLTALSSSSIAQDAPEAVAALQQLVGNWTGTGTFTDGETTMNIELTFNCESVSAGFGVLCRDELTGISGAGTVAATHLFGWDPGDGLVHWFAVTSAGETHDHAGSFTGNVLAVEHTGPMGGALFSEQITITFSEGSATGTSTVRVGNQVVGELNLTMTH